MKILLTSLPISSEGRRWTMNGRCKVVICALALSFLPQVADAVNPPREFMCAEEGRFLSAAELLEIAPENLARDKTNAQAADAEITMSNHQFGYVE